MLPEIKVDKYTKPKKYILVGVAILATAFICAKVMDGFNLYWGLALFILGSINGYTMCTLDYIKMIEKKQIKGEEDNGLDGKTE
jgi:hypothetical protein